MWDGILYLQTNGIEDDERIPKAKNHLIFRFSEENIVYVGSLYAGFYKEGLSFFCVKKEKAVGGAKHQISMRTALNGSET